MFTSLIAMVPKAAAMAIGGLVLAGSAMGASAAVGGPNVPAAVMTAVGVHAQTHATASIGNAPSAAATGKAHANAHASLGIGNASDQATTTPTATPTVGATVTSGINLAPGAAANGALHANVAASLGSGNANAGVGVGLDVANPVGGASTQVQAGAGANVSGNASLGLSTASHVQNALSSDIGAALSGVAHLATSTSLGASAH